jgi:hypothetical protein
VGKHGMVKKVEFSDQRPFTFVDLDRITLASCKKNLFSNCISLRPRYHFFVPGQVSTRTCQRVLLKMCVQ